MKYKFAFWIKTSAILQFLTAALHSTSFICPPVGQNDSEKQMIELMSVPMDMGNGFHPSMHDIVTSLSIIFVLFLVMSGVINLYLLKRKEDLSLIKNITLINIIFFGLCFIDYVFLTFLPPIVTTGLIFISLLMTYFSIPGRKSE